MSEHCVFITQTASCLPGPPVDNERVEALLGMVGAKPSRARRIVQRNNGIKNRHYAIDPESGLATLSNAQLAAAAVRGLGSENFALDDIECLVSGTSLPDQLMPSHAVMVHGELAIRACEVVSTAGICTAGAAALKYAYLSVLSGNSRNAVATGSELVSPVLHARNFSAEQRSHVEALKRHPEIAFEKDFLRWMLSDGAGALLLQNAPRASGISLRIEWIELFSYANELPPCMYAGAQKDSNGGLRGWAQYSAEERDRDSILSIKQDVRLLDANIISHSLRKPLQRVMAKRRLSVAAIDWFLPHMSSEYFRQPIADCLAQLQLPIPQQRWFTNLADKGNTGAAAFYIMLDELFRSGRIEAGQGLLCFVPESGRFSSAFVYLRAVEAN
jgi:3-oxoacyl-[acyl-carrier-protein] synthase-3